MLGKLSYSSLTDQPRAKVLGKLSYSSLTDQSRAKVLGKLSYSVISLVLMCLASFLTHL